MATALTVPSNKAERGTKRACQECEVRFYDLARDPMVCPACGAQRAADAPEPVFDVGTHVARAAGKSGWRKPSKRPDPVLPEADSDRAVPAEAAVDDLDGADDEDVKGAAPDDDIVLEQEPDDADVSGLVDVDVEEPKGGS